MLLNGRAGTHDIYLPDRRARVRPERSKAAAEARDRGVVPDPKGSFEERCAWMRQRQLKARRRSA